MKRFLLFTAIAVALSGCSKLTQQNYDSLKMGMSLEEISDIIGKPDECSETLGAKSCIWGSEDGTNIKITFMGDNAATFSNNNLN